MRLVSDTPPISEVKEKITLLHLHVQEFFRKLIERCLSLNIDVVFLGLVFFYRFAYSVNGRGNWQANLLFHAKHALTHFPNGKGFPHFLFHALTYGTSFLWPGKDKVKIAATLVLTTLMICKYLLVRKPFIDITRKENSLNKVSTLHHVVCIGFAISLMFVMALPQTSELHKVYLGYLSANPWHNPTFITMIPFALLAHWYIVQYIEGLRRNGIILSIPWLALSALGKPVYVLLAIGALFLMLLFFFRKDKRGWLHFTALCLGSLGIVLWQYLKLYKVGQPSSSISISPFTVWKHFSDNIPLATVCSLLFPATVTLVFFNKAKQSRRLIFGWLLFIISVTVYVLFIEEGRRKWHANFSWYQSCGTFFLFLESAIFLWKMKFRIHNKTSKNKFFICVFALGLHFISGFYFFYHRTSRLQDFITA